MQTTTISPSSRQWYRHGEERGEKTPQDYNVYKPDSPAGGHAIGPSRKRPPRAPPAFCLCLLAAAFFRHKLLSGIT